MPSRPDVTYCAYKGIVGFTMGLYLYTYLLDIGKMSQGGDTRQDESTLALVSHSGSLLSLAVLCISIAAFEIPGGWVADWFGRKKALVAAMIARAAFFALLGLAALDSAPFPPMPTALLAMVVLAAFVALDSGTVSAWLRHELDAQTSPRSFALIRARAQWIQTILMFAGALASVLVAQRPGHPSYWCYFAASSVVAVFCIWMLRHMGDGGRSQKPRLLRAALSEFRGKPVLLATGAYLACVYAVFYTVDGFWLAELPGGNGAASSARLLPILALFTLGSASLSFVADRLLGSQRFKHYADSRLHLTLALGVSTLVFAAPLLVGFWCSLGPQANFAFVMLVLCLHKAGDATIEVWTDSIQNLCIANDDVRATCMSLVSMIRSIVAAGLALLAWRCPGTLSSPTVLWAASAACCLAAYPIVLVSMRRHITSAKGEA